MALRDRVHSLETEYAISFFADGDDQEPGSGSIVDALMEAVGQSHGAESTLFLLNGSRLAHDVGHAEWSLPECRSGREAALYDKAADYLLLTSVVPQAERLLLREGFKGRLVVTKNNADPHGNTYGCHENYQMQRDSELMGGETFIRYLAHSLIPFLVSRQILTGAGRIVVEDGIGAQPVRYELSQRAGFIQTVISRDTTRARPIFNLGREGEPFASGNARRLHPILGDANLSGWATWVKMGSTGLMLRLVEDVFMDDIPALAEPLEALWSISRDVTGRAIVQLQDGREVSALDIQWMYYDLGDGYLNVFGASPEDEALMEAWGKALEDFGRDPMLLRDRADWAIKRQFLDALVQQQGLSLHELTTASDLSTEVQAFDLRYHELSASGLYCRAYPVDTLFSQAELERAMEYPPPYTRANVRGEAVRLARECALDVRADRWTEVSIEGESLTLDKPMEFDHPLLAQWDRPWAVLENRLAQADEGEAALCYKLGRSWLDAGQYGKAVEALRQAVELDAGDTASLRALAYALLWTGSYADAVQVFEKHNQIVEHSRSKDDAQQQDFTGLGDAHRYLGDYGKALQLYRKATQADLPPQVPAYRNMALIHLKRGETESAETYFSKSIQHSTERLISWIGLGCLQAARGTPNPVWFENALALSDRRATVGLTQDAAQVVALIARLALEQDGALPLLEARLAQLPPAAADGLFVLEPLVSLLANAPQPPRDVAEALTLARSAVVLPGREDGSPPFALERRVLWLENALTHPNEEVRLFAAAAAGWHLEAESGWDRLWARLVTCAHEDSDARVRRAAVQTMGKAGASHSDATDELIKCLHDDHVAVRWAAEASLTQINRPVRRASRVPVLVATYDPEAARRGEGLVEVVPDWLNTF